MERRGWIFGESELARTLHILMTPTLHTDAEGTVTLGQEPHSRGRDWGRLAIPSAEGREGTGKEETNHDTPGVALLDALPSQHYGFSYSSGASFLQLQKSKKMVHFLG